MKMRLPMVTPRQHSFMSRGPGLFAVFLLSVVAFFVTAFAEWAVLRTLLWTLGVDSLPRSKWSLIFLIPPVAALCLVSLITSFIDARCEKCGSAMKRGYYDYNSSFSRVKYVCRDCNHEDDWGEKVSSGGGSVGGG